MGLLNASDWKARWIEPAEDIDLRSRSPRPGHLLRGPFELTDRVVRARLHATAHGIYEVFLNGERVGDWELTPGFTSYRHILQVQTYNVTSLLRLGPNILGAIVTDGWYRGQVSAYRRTNVFGDRVGLLAQLNLELADGSVRQLGTGPDWIFRMGSVLEADLMQGQVVDLRKEPSGWSIPGASTSGWSSVDVADYALTNLHASPGPAVRRIEEITPVNLTRPVADRHIFDLGQNINGWVRLSRLGPVGAVLTLTHGETLDREGNVTLKNLVPEFHNNRGPIQTDRVHCPDIPGATFEPRHTTHGFQYVQVDGHPEVLSVKDLIGIVVHSDLRRTGWFECSNTRLNRLHEAAVWSFRGNACDIPTDCPQRERHGWTGDWQIFVPTAAFLYDVAGFSVKWLQDLAADQRSDGAVPHGVPDTMSHQVSSDEIPMGSAGWGDAAVIVPWEIYCAYGDDRLLREQWPSMKRWVDYAVRQAREGRHPNRAASRPVVAPHEEFIWDTGFHWGEWTEPGTTGALPDKSADQSAVATAYLHLSCRLLASIADVLGRGEDVGRYSRLAQATKAAWQAEFIGPEGLLIPDTQATYVRALAFGLAPEGMRAGLAGRLVELIEEAGMHLGTGFLSTPYLLPVLVDSGHSDIAFALLLQDTEPSWLTMIDRGATTIWEFWNGIDSSGSAHYSLNHYSKGAVVSFLHRYVAGIRRLDAYPAYRRFIIQPLLGGGITWARARLDSPYGSIESSWHHDGETFELDITVPPGATAEVLLPDGKRFGASSGRAHFRADVGDRLSRNS